MKFKAGDKIIHKENNDDVHLIIKIGDHSYDVENYGWQDRMWIEYTYRKATKLDAVLR